MQLSIANESIYQRDFAYGTGNITILIKDAQPVFILTGEISRGAVLTIEMLLFEAQLHGSTAIATVHLDIFSNW